MAVPFPEAQIEALIYMVLGSLLTLVTVLTLYIRRLHSRMEDSSENEEEQDEPDLRTDNIGLSKKAEDILDKVLENPELQSDLPQKLKVSKATVSNGISELKDRSLIKRRKKANTYLVEPDIERLEEEQR
ncbi:MAG: putative membrane protein [Candidatus Nanohaloarchaea archaeon]|jgi:uncharacterized membrane protein